MQLVADLLVGQHLVGTVDALGDRLDLLEQRHLVGVDRRELRRPAFGDLGHAVGQRLDPLRALGPVLAQMRLGALLGDETLTASISASVSPAKWLIATTTGTPKPLTFSIWRPRLAQPPDNASTFSVPRSALATPPFIFIALTVATSTTQSGASPPCGI
jgi:hypothetical protein